MLLALEPLFVPEGSAALQLERRSNTRLVASLLLQNAALHCTANQIG